MRVIDAIICSKSSRTGALLIYISQQLGILGLDFAFLGLLKVLVLSEQGATLLIRNMEGLKKMRCAHSQCHLLKLNAINAYRETSMFEFVI